LGLVCYNGLGTNEYDHIEASYLSYETPHYGNAQELQSPHYFSEFMPEDESESNINVTSVSIYNNPSSSSSAALSMFSSESKSEANETIYQAYQYSGTVGSNASNNTSGVGLSGGFSLNITTK